MPLFDRTRHPLCSQACTMGWAEHPEDARKPSTPGRCWQCGNRLYAVAAYTASTEEDLLEGE